MIKKESIYCRNWLKRARYSILPVLLVAVGCGTEVEPEPTEPTTKNEILPQTITPRAMLIDLLAFLDERVNDPKVVPTIKKVYENEISTIKSKVMRHDLTSESTKKYFEDLEKNSPQEIASKAQELLKIFPDKLNLASVWEDFYARIFDSFFVNELVKNPPEEVQVAMTMLGSGLGELMERELARIPPVLPKDNLDQKIFELLKTEEPRFWFPKVAAIVDIQTSGPQDASTKLISYLKAKKQSGWEVISVPYFIVKVGLVLGKLKRRPAYLKEATDAYKDLHKMVVGIRENIPIDKSLETTSAGITLRGQPKVIAEDWMTPSIKPTDFRFPRVAQKDPRATQEAYFALTNQLSHGVGWASGMSGSTNIDLFATSWLINHSNPTVRKDIDIKAAFLGIIMFLVYDGGHTISEPLWAANEIDEKLNLNFNLSDSPDIHTFISDFERFVKIYQNSAFYSAITNAFDKAFEESIASFKKYGYKVETSFKPEW